MNSPAASRAMQTKTTSSESCQSVTSHYTWLGKNTFHFLLVTLSRLAHMRQTEFMPFVCSVPVYLEDYYIPCIMAAIIE
jgi:hypothetical protein